MKHLNQFMQHRMAPDETSQLTLCNMEKHRPRIRPRAQRRRTTLHLQRAGRRPARRQTAAAHLHPLAAVEPVLSRGEWRTRLACPPAAWSSLPSCAGHGARCLPVRGTELLLCSPMELPAMATARSSSSSRRGSQQRPERTKLSVF
jgi:hypothetical protein